MASAGTLIFELAADVSRLRQDMGKAQKEIKSSLGDIAKNTAVTALKAGYDFAMEFARGFSEKISQAMESADAIGKLSTRVGVSTEALSALKIQAESAGVSIDTVTGAFQGWAKASADLRKPTSDASAAISALGLTVDDLKGKNPEEAMKTIAQAMSGFKDGADKMQAARILFGKAGAEMLPMLADGAKGFDEWTQKAKELGVVISKEDAKGAAEFNDSLADLHTMVNGAWQTLANYLLPTLKDLVKWFGEDIKEGGFLSETLIVLAKSANIAAQAMVGVEGMSKSASLGWKAWKEAVNAPIDDPKAQKESINRIKGYYDQIQTTMDKTADRQKELAAGFEKTIAEIRNRPKSTLGDDAEDDGKKVMHLNDALNKAGTSGKKAKESLSDYQQMLKSMSEELRVAAANGDELQKLMTDPRVVKMTQQEQETLKGLLETRLQVNAANEDAKRINDERVAASKKADEDLVAQVEHLRDVADAAKDAADPMRQYLRTIQELQAAKDKGFFDTDPSAFVKAMNDAKKAADDAKKGLDHTKDGLADLQQAIEGFGRESSDALVDFMFATDGASQSFSEMVVSMLKDLSKLLVYKNVFEPLVKGINSGIAGGSWASAISSLFSGARMSGGTVGAGRMYSVNETPLRGEYFVPNVPGAVRTSEQMGSAGGVNVQVNVYKGGVTDDVQADSAQGVELGKRVATVVRQVIAQEKRTGGLLAPT